MTEVAPGVVCLTLSRFVNVFFVGEPGGRWWLIDAGIGSHFDPIRAAAAARFGPDSAPEAILITHGHLDHVGAARALAAYWDVPIRIDAGDLPFVDGRWLWPPLDPTTGGAMGFLARFMPRRLIDLSPRVEALESAPDGWEIVPLPGHTPGQVGFWRPSDKVLIAGDALANVNLESWAGILLGRPRLSMPPGPATLDWVAVRRSLRRIAALRPEVLLCGHGEPQVGPEVADELEGFAEYAITARNGRYVAEPVEIGDDGPQIPPPIPDPAATVLKAAALAGVVGVGLWLWRRRRS